MVKVYFEVSFGCYAEHVATFESEEIYNAVLPKLEEVAKKLGFDRVTESIQ